MEPASWLVALLFGFAVGVYFGRHRQDQEAVLGAQVASVLIGVVVWIASPQHMAGPSLVVGCGAGLAGLLLSRRTVRA